MKKVKQILIAGLLGLSLFGLSVFAWVKAPGAYSMSERRSLAQLPALSAETLVSGKYMTGFDAYAADQFPMRDGFRYFKSAVARTVFRQKDVHGLYVENGYLSKLEYPINDERVNRAIRKINEIQTSYLEGTDCRTYLSVIPDKNYFLASPYGYPALDYEELAGRVYDGTFCETYIDIFDLLSLEDYYRTDQHWRQECVIPVAQRLVGEMNPEAAGCGLTDYEEHVLDQPFYGAYVGQAAISIAPDEIHYLTSECIDGCKVTSYNTGAAAQAQMYDLSKAYGRDPYEMFLSGSDPLLVIENPGASSEKELVVFRDSFGSSLIPLMVDAYEKITVVDLRYMRSNLLGNYIEFDDQDVLFLYSALILNNNISM